MSNRSARVVTAAGEGACGPRRERAQKLKVATEVDRLQKQEEMNWQSKTN